MFTFSALGAAFWFAFVLLCTPTGGSPLFVVDCNAIRCAGGYCFGVVKAASNYASIYAACSSLQQSLALYSYTRTALLQTMTSAVIAGGNVNTWVAGVCNNNDYYYLTPAGTTGCASVSTSMVGLCYITTCNVDIYCNGRASSASGTPATGCTCVCNAGYGGTNCEQCGAGYTGNYPSCTSVCEMIVCNGHADGVSLDESGRCRCSCFPPYSGYLCDSCAPGYTNYSSCVPIPCNSSNCNDRASEVTGLIPFHNCTCTCLAAFTGPTCSSCSLGYEAYPTCSAKACNINNDCYGHADTVNGTEPTGCTCHCRMNFAGLQCSYCAAGYNGLGGYPSCLPEPCDAVVHCNGHASAVNGTIPGNNCSCTCAAGYDGLKCERCAAHYDGYPLCVPQSCSVDVDCSGHASEVHGFVAYGCNCTCRSNYVGIACEQCRLWVPSGVTMGRKIANRLASEWVCATFTRSLSASPSLSTSKSRWTESNAAPGGTYTASHGAVSPTRTPMVVSTPSTSPTRTKVVTGTRSGGGGGTSSGNIIASVTSSRDIRSPSPSPTATIALPLPPVFVLSAAATAGGATTAMSLASSALGASGSLMALQRLVAVLGNLDCQQLDPPSATSNPLAWRLGGGWELSAGAAAAIIEAWGLEGSKFAALSGQFNFTDPNADTTIVKVQDTAAAYRATALCFMCIGVFAVLFRLLIVGVQRFTEQAEEKERRKQVAYAAADGIWYRPHGGGSTPAPTLWSRLVRVSYFTQSYALSMMFLQTCVSPMICAAVTAATMLQGYVWQDGALLLFAFAVSVASCGWMMYQTSGRRLRSLVGMDMVIVPRPGGLASVFATEMAANAGDEGDGVSPKERLQRVRQTLGTWRASCGAIRGVPDAFRWWAYPRSIWVPRRVRGAPSALNVSGFLTLRQLEPVIGDFYPDRSWYAGVDFAGTIIMGVLGSIRSPSTITCGALSILLVLLAAVLLILLLFLRPYTTPFQMHFAVIMGVCSLLIAVLGLVPDGNAAAQVVGLLTTVLQVVQVVLSLFIMLISWFGRLEGSRASWIHAMRRRMFAGRTVPASVRRLQSLPEDHEMMMLREATMLTVDDEYDDEYDDDDFGESEGGLPTRGGRGRESRQQPPPRRHLGSGVDDYLVNLTDTHDVPTNDTTIAPSALTAAGSGSRAAPMDPRGSSQDANPLHRWGPALRPEAFHQRQKPVQQHPRDSFAVAAAPIDVIVDEEVDRCLRSNDDPEGDADGGPVAPTISWPVADRGNGGGAALSDAVGVPNDSISVRPHHGRKTTKSKVVKAKKFKVQMEANDIETLLLQD